MSNDANRPNPAASPSGSEPAQKPSHEADSARLEEHDAAPRKQHGDALLDGSGNRHGVDDRNERPEIPG